MINALKNKAKGKKSILLIHLIWFTNEMLKTNMLIYKQKKWNFENITQVKIK